MNTSFTQVLPEYLFACLMEPVLSFQQNKDLDFKKALHQRVNDYFSHTGLSRNHNPAMLVKTILLLSLYIVPFIVILTVSLPVWIVMVLYFIMGVGVAGVGMSVMHDGNHFGYSENQTVNRWMGLTMNLLGADAYNWKIKHNKLHHVFTNIYGKDEDIASRVILRFAYAAPLKWYHRYQHLYGWFFYALMSISMVFGDVAKRINYRRRGITNIPPETFRRSMIWLIVSKVIYTLVIFGLPLIMTSLTWWQVLLGFLIMQLTSGTILSLVFQMAHVVEGPEQPLPDANGQMSDSLLAHQLKTTSDFSRKNKILSWYVGGLNFQIEHHLFPRICHVHYPALASIVENTTREFNMPYYVHDSFFNALRSHIKTLKRLGREKVNT